MRTALQPGPALDLAEDTEEDRVRTARLTGRPVDVVARGRAAIGGHHGSLNDQTATWVRAEISTVLDDLGGHPLLIGKSLGSLAAGVAADRSLPAVRLTPLLTMPSAVVAMERATAPFLLVGGTADSWWDGMTARRLTPYVLEVEGVDQGMFVAGGD
jgi:hypothetical protein